MAGRCGGAAERKLGRGAATCGAAERGAAKFGIGRTIGAAGRAIGAGRTIAGGGAGRAIGGGAAGRAIGAAPTPGAPCPRGWACASMPATSRQVPIKTATKRLPRRSMVAAPVNKAARYRNAYGTESFAVRRNNRWQRCVKLARRANHFWFTQIASSPSKKNIPLFRREGRVHKRFQPAPFRRGRNAIVS